LIYKKYMDSSVKLNIVGAYSDNDEMELSGTSEAFDTLGEFLVGTNQPEVRILLFIPTVHRLLPYGHFFSAIQIVRKSDSAVEIKRENDTLIFSGSNQNLEKLAKNFLRASGEKAGNHFHLEYYPSNYPEIQNYLAPSSQPLVVTVEDNTLIS
jgi:hypothetical protein